MGALSMGDAMKAFLEKSKVQGRIQALQVHDVWEEIMGKTVARYTDKLQVVGKTLHIHTSVGPLRQELLYQKAKIVQRVNELLGAGTIEEVVVR